jgi:hypothetical protein
MATNRTRLSDPVVRPRAGLEASRSTGCPGPPGEAQHPGEDTKAGVLALWGEVASLGKL